MEIKQSSKPRRGQREYSVEGAEHSNYRLIEKDMGQQRKCFVSETRRPRGSTRKPGKVRENGVTGEEMI